MDKRPEIPRLDTTNYGPWMVATRAAAHTTGAIEHITGNRLPPNDPTELTTFHKNKHYLLGELITSIPPEIASVMHKPAKEHKNHLHWHLRYLSGTKYHGILFKPGPRSASPSLCTYSDSDFANDHDHKSRSGVVDMFHGALLGWASARQTVDADSTYEAEYLAATAATQQVHWLRRLLGETCMPETQPKPLLVDSKAAIFVAQNSAPTKRRKFIDVKHHLIHNLIQRGTVNIQHIPSNENLADYFTKPLVPQRTQYLLSNLSIVAPKLLMANPRTV